MTSYSLNSLNLHIPYSCLCVQPLGMKLSWITQNYTSITYQTSNNTSNQRAHQFLIIFLIITPLKPMSFIIHQFWGRFMQWLVHLLCFQTWQKLLETKNLLKSSRMSRGWRGKRTNSNDGFQTVLSRVQSMVWLGTTGSITKDSESSWPLELSVLQWSCPVILL